MEVIKKYRVLILVVVPVIILVLLRSLGTNHFRPDAKRWAEPSIMRTNIITKNQIETLSGEKLMINLDKEDTKIKDITITQLDIPAETFIKNENLNNIRKHNGPVLLFSFRPDISARIWMYLSQMGFRNIYILSIDTDNEVLKYKFRPDTLIRPELNH